MNGTTRFLATVSEEAKGQTRNVCNQTGYESVVLVPIPLAGQILGLIHIADPKKNMVPLAVVKMLEGIGRQVASAIERIRTQEELLATKDYTENIIRSMADMLLVVSPEGKIVTVNEATRRLLGFSEHELIGQPATLLFQEEEEEEEEEEIPQLIISQQALPVKRTVLRRLVREGSVSNIEKSLLTKNGEKIPVLLSGSVMRDNQGEIQGIVCLALDITERKKMERELAKSEEQYRAISEDMPVLICRFRPDCTITYVNKAYCDYFQKTPEELVGNSFPSLIVEADRERVMANILSLTPDSPSQSHEHQVTAPDGEIRWQRWINRAILDAQGKVISYQSIGEDVTEHKQAEENLRWYQARLRSMAAELAMAEERERRRIAAGLHDEVAQVLAAARMKLRTLEKEPAKQELNASVDEIRALIEQAIQDTRSLVFDLSPPILHELGFTAAVRSLTERIRAEHGIRAIFEDDDQPKPLHEDTQQILFRAVRELLINVVKHARAKQVKVSAQKQGPNIQIEVQDDGTGFNPAGIWSRKDPTHGFGLFNIHERLDYLGGSAQVQSEPGRGTRVTLLAPLNLEAKVS